MEILANNNIVFTSRKFEIRFADDIARRANKCYPRLSNTKVDGFTHANDKKFKMLKVNLSARVGAVRTIQWGLFDPARTFSDKLSSVVNPLLRFNVGNCSESAELTTLIAKVNGLENAKMRRLVSEDGQSFDHIITYVDGKKPYIIDGWFGFADYKDNAIRKYKDLFGKFFKFEDYKTDKMIAQEIPNEFRIPAFVNSEFSPEQVELVKTLFPKFVLNK